MKLEVLRISSEGTSTNGILFDVSNNQRKFLSYTLEDEYRDDKVMSKTRIPAGTYELLFEKKVVCINHILSVLVLILIRECYGLGMFITLNTFISISVTPPRTPQDVCWLGILRITIRLWRTDLLVLQRITIKESTLRLLRYWKMVEMLRLPILIMMEILNTHQRRNDTRS